MSLRLLMAATAVTALIAGAGIATAQENSGTGTTDNLKKLENFQSTHSATFKVVDQSADDAAAISKILERIKMPKGFKIQLYAIVPDARMMTVGPQGIVTIVGTRKNEVWSVTDRNKDRVADEVKSFAPSLEFQIPNGVCFSPDGMLYVVEQNRVMKFPAAEFFYESPDVAAADIVPQGTLIPKEYESFNHSARVCTVGPDGKLYITLGQPWNVPPADKLADLQQRGIGGIIRMDQDGSNREVYTRGVRNSVGAAFDPKTGDLWFTDNQVDGMGDEIPPGELNHQTKMGQNFGFPWYGGGHTRTVEYKNDEPPKDVVFPVIEFPAHAADLGMMFYTGKQFPAKYHGGIFSAEHGSWNRTKPVGARIMFTTVDKDGKAKTEVFADGWLDEQSGEYLGRPVDVTQLPDGSMLVSDDLVGAIYRISYSGK